MGLLLDLTFEDGTIQNPEGKDVFVCRVKSHGVEVARFMGPGLCGGWLYQVRDLNGEYPELAHKIVPSLELGKEALRQQVLIFNKQLVEMERRFCSPKEAQK
jgi:hypothetical protein